MLEIPVALYTFMYTVAASIIPILFLLLFIRILGRSTKKTVNTFRK